MEFDKQDIVGSCEFEIQEGEFRITNILDKRVFDGGKVRYLVEWASSWESKDKLQGSEKLILHYENRLTARKLPSRKCKQIERKCDQKVAYCSSDSDECVDGTAKAVLDKRVVGLNRTEYLIQWNNSWEDKDGIYYTDLIEKFESKLSATTELPSKSTTNGDRKGKKPSPKLLTGKYHYVIKAVLDKRIVNGKIEYLLQWTGYGDEFNKWIAKEDIRCQYKIAEFEQEYQRKHEKLSMRVTPVAKRVDSPETIVIASDSSEGSTESVYDPDSDYIEDSE